MPRLLEGPHDPPLARCCAVHKEERHTLFPVSQVREATAPFAAVCIDASMSAVLLVRGGMAEVGAGHSTAKSNFDTVSQIYNIVGKLRYPVTTRSIDAGIFGNGQGRTTILLEKGNSMTRSNVFLALALMFAVNFVQAETVSPDIAKKIRERFPDTETTHIAPAPVPGIYEVSVGGDLIYVTSDSRYAFSGRLYDLEKREDLSEPVFSQLRLQELKKADENNMIVFEPKGEAKHTITTFTDVDCPYCRKMHSEIGELSAAGIRVRYVLYPRTAMGSPSYEKAISVWCAEDRNKALTQAKSGEEVEKRECPNPVAQSIELGNRLGLSGTPMTISDSGEQFNGYVPADQLALQLNGAAPETSQ